MTTKKLQTNAFGHTYEQFHRLWFAQLEPGVLFEDLFFPRFWSHHALKLKPRDQIRVRAHDGSFDVMLTVVAVPTGGVVVDLWPRFPKGTDAQAEADARAEAAKLGKTKVRILPNGKLSVRVEFLPATLWRLIGDDQKEVSRNHESEEAANKAMEKYLEECRMELPSAEEIAAASEAIANASRAKKPAGKAA
jgi:hypothetical protein